MNVLILDDHSLFSMGLGKILEDSFKKTSIDYFKSIKDIYKNNIEFSNYDILITDIELPGENIFEFFSHIKVNHPEIPILVITMHNKLSVVKKCKELGLEGYILKDENEEVVNAITSLLKKEEFYSKKILTTLNIQNIHQAFLTPKEEEIMKLTAQGVNNKEIAEKLFISYNTVKTHKKNINKKLDISSTSELINYCLKNYI